MVSQKNTQGESIICKEEKKNKKKKTQQFEGRI